MSSIASASADDSEQQLLIFSLATCSVSLLASLVFYSVQRCVRMPQLAAWDEETVSSTSRPSTPLASSARFVQRLESKLRFIQSSLLWMAVVEFLVLVLFAALLIAVGGDQRLDLLLRLLLPSAAMGASWLIFYSANHMLNKNFPRSSLSLSPDSGWQHRFHDPLFMALMVLLLCLQLALTIDNWVMIFTPNAHSSSSVGIRWDILGLVMVTLRLALVLAVTTVCTQVWRQVRAGYISLESETTTSSSRKTSYMDRMRDLMPFMWPRSSKWLQLMVVLSVLTLICGRAVNLLLPIQYKRIIDALTPSALDGTLGGLPVGPFLVYIFLYYCQGSAGLVSTIQSTLWIPVEQYVTREVSLRMFRHLHGLSLRWHLNRKTGEVLRVMDRGTQAIASLLSYIWFSIVPVIVDIIIAVIYFCVQFDMYFGIVVFVTMALYLTVTILITEWRTKYRRKMIELENATNTKAVDSLLNFETVKYYGNEEFEGNSYQQRIRNYQKADFQSQLSLKLLNTTQNTVISLGMLTGGLLCAYRVVKGELKVGDFVLFIAYLQQLYQPLNWFGTYYRMIQQNFIDMEKMLDLFKEDPEVKDAPDAKQLRVESGSVVFDNVCFRYDNKSPDAPELKNISFEIPAGKTVALVGPSGGGKSTILRLLFRFYEVQSGRILVDGQDIRSVTQRSLRQSIGVVPQDTVLFNDTIFYNIQYGNIGASEEAVEKAAGQAQIHEKIQTFGEKYATMVGERGLRLSGGEKQRVAIARTILKDPKIILLDEATSALDTNTERQIQKELNKMTKGRTTLIIAHRLSTIVNADLILVVKDGEIVERGKHAELLKKDGLYHQLWTKQLEADNTE